GQEIIEQRDKMRPKLQQLTADFAENQKAVDNLKKSVESMTNTYSVNIATFGQSLLQVEEYKLRLQAAKLGLTEWLNVQLKAIETQDRDLKLKQEYARFADEAEKRKHKQGWGFSDDDLKKLREGIALQQQQLDLQLKFQEAAGFSFTIAPGVNDQFQQAYDEQ